MDVVLELKLAKIVAVPEQCEEVQWQVVVSNKSRAIRVQSERRCATPGIETESLTEFSLLASWCENLTFGCAGNERDNQPNQLHVDINHGRVIIELMAFDKQSTKPFALYSHETRLAGLLGSHKVPLFDVNGQVIGREMDGTPVRRKCAVLQVGMRIVAPYGVAHVRYSDLGFESSSFVGAGAYATVKKCTWLTMPVACKIFHEGPTTLRFFVEEVVALSKFRSPYIVSLLAISCSRLDTVCVVTEMVFGGDLCNLVEQAPPLSYSLILQIARDVLRALACVHRIEFIHRDIKPGNCLMVCADERLCASGESHAVFAKICDFGCTAERSDQMSLGVGTPDYMAPEVTTKRTYTMSADIYSLGVMLYFMVTKHNFFETHAQKLFSNWEKERVVSQGWRPTLHKDVCHPTLAQFVETLWIGDHQQRPTALQCLAHVSDMMVTVRAWGHRNNREDNTPLDMLSLVKESKVEHDSGRDKSYNGDDDVAVFVPKRRASFASNMESTNMDIDAIRRQASLNRAKQEAFDELRAAGRLRRGKSSTDAPAVKETSGSEVKSPVKQRRNGGDSRSPDDDGRKLRRRKSANDSAQGDEQKSIVESLHNKLETPEQHQRIRSPPRRTGCDSSDEQHHNKKRSPTRRTGSEMLKKSGDSSDEQHHRKRSPTRRTGSELRKSGDSSDTRKKSGSRRAHREKEKFDSPRKSRRSKRESPTNMADVPALQRSVSEMPKRSRSKHSPTSSASGLSATSSSDTETALTVKSGASLILSPRLARMHNVKSDLDPIAESNRRAKDSNGLFSHKSAGDVIPGITTTSASGRFSSWDTQQQKEASMRGGSLSTSSRLTKE